MSAANKANKEYRNYRDDFFDKSNNPMKRRYSRDMALKRRRQKDAFVKGVNNDVKEKGYNVSRAQFFPAGSEDFPERGVLRIDEPVRYDNLGRNSEECDPFRGQISNFLQGNSYYKNGHWVQPEWGYAYEIEKSEPWARIRQKNESVARRVTESVMRKLRRGSIHETTQRPKVIDVGSIYKDADFERISENIGNYVGQTFKDYFLNTEQWDLSDLETEISFKFLDIDKPLKVRVGGGVYIYYDDDDQPIKAEIWVGMGNYAVFYGDFDRNDLSRDMSSRINWEKVERIVGSYSMTASDPDFLRAYDTGMEKQVAGYDKNQRPRGRAF